MEWHKERTRTTAALAWLRDERKKEGRREKREGRREKEGESETVKEWGEYTSRSRAERAFAKWINRHIIHARPALWRWPTLGLCWHTPSSELSEVGEEKRRPVSGRKTLR
jgi:hypothetical protein